MNKFKSFIAGVLVTGMCLSPFSAKAYVIPIASVFEISLSDILLMVESEITYWKQEALKYKEMFYTSLLGGVSLGAGNQIISQMKTAAQDGASIIEKSKVDLSEVGVSNLADFNQAKAQMEENLIIRVSEGLEHYTTEQIEEIHEKQRMAINEMASNGIAMAATESVNSSDSSEKSKPEDRAKAIAEAKDAQQMAEIMLAVDRQIYERSLHVSNVEAAAAGIQAMQVLNGISRSGHALVSKEEGGS